MVARVGVEKLQERLLGVNGMRVQGARFEPRGVVVEVQPPRRKSRCGVYGRLCPRYDSCPPPLWRHLALGRTAFWLSYTPRRVVKQRGPPGSRSFRPLSRASRLVMRRAYGFRNTAVLKGMVFLCCGGLTLNPPLPSLA